MEALAVMATCAAGCCGVHVPAQFPLFSDVSRTGISPLSKLTVTPPLVIGLAQSSITFTETCEGKPATTLDPAPTWVNTGASKVGLQEGAACACSGSVEPAGIT